MAVHCKQNLGDSWILFDKTFLGLELGTLFPARESLVSDIPAGDGNIAKLFLQCGGGALGRNGDISRISRAVKSWHDLYEGNSGESALLTAFHVRQSPQSNYTRSIKI